MISVIVCSANPSFLKSFTESLKNSIGVSYELLVFDNRKFKYGICKVYNNLVKQAQFDIVCFVHEDVLFKTENWGKIVLGYFKSYTEMGALGVAGGKYKSNFLSGWYNKYAESDCCNIRHEMNGEREIVILNPDSNKKIHEVVCLDGVFICARKDVFEEVLWNEDVLKGFHFYDIDFSLQVSRLKKLFVVYDIDLVHITKGGDYGDKWVNEAFLFHEKMKHLMPAFTDSIKNAQLFKKTINAWLDRLKNEKITFSNRIKWIDSQKLWKYPSAYYSIFKFLLYKPLRLYFLHNLFKSK